MPFSSDFIQTAPNFIGFTVIPTTHPLDTARKGVACCAAGCLGSRFVLYNEKVNMCVTEQTNSAFVRNDALSHFGDDLPSVHTYFERHIMNFIIWLIVGGLIGWLASMVMKTDGQQGIILNVIVGIVGAMLAGWFISPLVGVGTINQDNFSLPALLISFVGAVVLLGAVNLLRRGSAR